MWSVYAHWVLLVGLTLGVSFLNSFYLIKQINFCSSCSKSEYIRKTAKRDVRAMAISFMALGMLLAVLTFVSKFRMYSRYGFASRVNSFRFNDIYIVLLYVAIIYNVFAFINFSAIASKCFSTAACREKRDLQKHKDEWVMVKTANVIYICVGLSYILYRFTCPRQRFGVPSRDVCKRVLCLNKITNKKELDRFNEIVEKVENSSEEDFSKKIRVIAEKMGLRRENGKRIRGDQAGFFDEVRHQIRSCASAADERIELLGFKPGTWQQNCSNIRKKSSESEKRKREEEEKRKEKRRKEKEKDQDLLRLIKRQREDREKRRQERSKDEKNK